MSLADDLAKFERKTNARMDAFVREYVGQLSLSLITKTPVGNPELWIAKKAAAGYVPGRLRANWQLGIGEVNSTVTEDRDTDGGETLDRIVGSIPMQAAGKVYFITNSLPYAKAIEDGHSKQAPAGMVTLTAIEHASIADIALTTIRGNNFGGG